MSKKHPNSLANLRPPWKKGESGNPVGRPPRPSLEALIEEVLDEPVSGTGYSHREVLARAFVSQCVKGHPRALALLFERAWPKPIQIEAKVEADVTGVAPYSEPFKNEKEIEQAFESLVAGKDETLQ
jgi:hypothetical protein